MKKNFVKKLAVALSLAMTVSTLAPAASADAAATPAFKTYRTSVYENGTNGGSYTYTVKNIKKGYTVKWSVTGDAKDYITVSKASTKATKTTVSNTIKVATNGDTAAKNGTATVKAVVYNTKGTKVKTVSDKVTVKVQATDVSIYAADGSDFVTAVGAAYDLNRTLTPANSTSKTYWEVTDASGSAVDIIDSQGVMTATAAGEYTVTANVKNAKTAKTVATATQKVTVKTAVMTGATQTKVKEVTTIFAGDTSNLVKSDFVITNTATKAVIPVSKVTVDSTDSSKVVLTTSGEMKDGKEYTVEYQGATFTFTATDGKVASLAVDPTTITAAELTEVNIQTLDANNVVIGEYPIGGSDTTVTMDTTPATNGYVSDGKLYLANVGDTATIKATYHTFKFDETGKETDSITSDLLVTAVADTTTVSNFVFTIAKENATPAFTSTGFTANTKVQVNAVSQAAFVYIKNSKGDEISSADYAKYTVESSDTSKLVVVAGALSKGGKTGSSAVKIIGVAEGTAYILVKDANGAVVASLQVTIYGESKIATISLSKSTVNVLTPAAASPNQEVTVVVKDQFGDEIAPTSFTVTCLSAPTGVTASDFDDAVLVSAGAIAADGTTFTVLTGAANTVGSYLFKIAATDGTNTISTTLTVKAVAPAAKDNYVVTLDKSTVDSTVTAKTATKQGISVTAKLTAMNNGAVSAEAVSLKSITLAKADGTVLAKIVSGSAATVSCAAITPGALSAATNSGIVTIDVTTTTGSGTKVVKNLAAGTYVVTLESFNGDTAKTTFAVTDTNVTVATSVTVTEADRTSASGNIKGGSVTFTAIYCGEEQTITGSAIETIKGAGVSSGGYTVTSATGWVTVPDTDLKIVVSLPISAYFPKATGLGN